MIFRGHKCAVAGGAIVDVATFERDNGETFDVHISRAADEPWPVAENGDSAWFILGFCFATSLGESFTFEHRVDAELVRNLRALSAQWSRWVKSIEPIRFVGLIEEDRPFLTNGANASFYSGGIDSLHTAITHEPPIDMLISIEHQPLDETAINGGLARLSELSDYASKSHRSHVRLVSNAMIVLPEINDLWAYVFHGAVYLAFANYLDGVTASTLSSSHSYGELIPWGSHPVTDVLISSKSMRADHFGAAYTRVEKTAAIAHDNVALGVLSVCGKGRLASEFVNCSRCPKCLRTMGTLDLLDTDRSKAVTFDWSGYLPQQLGTIFLRTKNEVIFYREIIDAARLRGRHDIAEACEKAISRSRIFSTLTWAEMSIRLRYPQVLRYKSSLLAIRGKVYGALGLQRAA